MRRVLMIVIIVVLAVALLAAGAFFAVLKWREKANEPQVDLGTIYQFPHKFIVDLEDSRSFVKAELAFEVEGEDIIQELEQRHAQICHIINLILRDKTSADLKGREGAEALNLEIFETLNAILVRGKIKRIMFIEFAIQ